MAEREPTEDPLTARDEAAAVTLKAGQEGRALRADEVRHYCAPGLGGDGLPTCVRCWHPPDDPIHLPPTG